MKKILSILLLIPLWVEAQPHSGPYPQPGGGSSSSATNVMNYFGTPTGTQIWVDPVGGNDSTAVTNRPDKPWLNFTNALTNATFGSTIYLYPGTNYLFSSNLVPFGVTIQGSGERISHFQSGSNDVGISSTAYLACDSLVTLQDFTFDDLNTNGGVVKVPIGIGCALTNVSGSAKGATNVTLRRVTINGGTDCIIASGMNGVDPTNRCTADFYDCHINTQWDAVVINAMGTNSIFNFYNCYGYGTNTGLSSQQHIIAFGGSSTNCIVNWYGGEIYSTGGNNGNNTCIRDGNQGCVVNVYCKVSMVTSGTGFVASTGTASSVINFYTLQQFTDSQLKTPITGQINYCSTWGTSTFTNLVSTFETNNGIGYTPTNAAPNKLISASGLNLPAENKGLTNNLGGRATLYIPIVQTAQFTNIFALTNTTAGYCLTNTFIVITGQASINQGQTLVYPDISAGDVLTFSNYSAQRSCTIVNPYWIVK